MNDISISKTQLPETIEDLTQFVLVGKAKLQAYMLKLQTVNKLSVAQEIRDQTLKETQEMSNALIAAEQRIGELLLAIPKATAYNNPSGKEGTQNRDTSKLGKTKTETISEMGYSMDEASEYQRMAKNPDIVQRVINEALERGEVVTKSQVLSEIKAAKEEAKAEAEANKSTREKFAEQKADRLETENKKLQEKVSQLENKEPETIEVEVAPKDYESIKKKAKEANAWKQDYQKQQALNVEKQKKILELQDQIKELREQTVREKTSKDFEAGAVYFIAQCGAFIRDCAGYVWIADRLQELSERDRIGYVKAAKAVKDWADVLLSNIERSEYGESVLQKLVDKSTERSSDD